MNKPRFGGLGSVMRGPALAQEDMPGCDPDEDAPDDEDESGPDAGAKKKDKTMTEKKEGAEAQAEAPKTTTVAAEQPVQQQGGDAVAAARTEERKRVADVFASEDVKGREMAAAELLANSDMSAAGIVAMLPKLTPAASADDGRQMLEQMRQGADADLGQGGDAEPQAVENHGWGKAHAKVSKMHGLARKAA